MTNLSALSQLRPEALNNLSPEKAVRACVEALVGTSLPPTKELTLYHIRGVGNPKQQGGQDKDSVIYGPEFLYLLDVGYPSACGVQIPWNGSGLGDPYFPDFSKAELRSVQGKTRSDLLFPCIPTELLVGIKDGIDEASVRQELAPFSTAIQLIRPNLYFVMVEAFHETSIAQELEAVDRVVKYAEPNRIVREIDFSPGWFVDQVR